MEPGITYKKETKVQPERPKKKWLGQDYCDFCKEKVSEHKDFYDAITYDGHWALMCDNCFPTHGQGKLGTGLGQKYDGKSFEKIAG